MSQKELLETFHVEGASCIKPKRVMIFQQDLEKILILYYNLYDEEKKSPVLNYVHEFFTKKLMPSLNANFSDFMKR